MAQHKSAIKRIRQNEKRRNLNRQHKSKLKTEINKFYRQDNIEEANTQYKQVTSLLDKLTCKGIIHRNKAARDKSKLARHIKGLS